MKQVVINGGETYGGLLTPKWMVEFLKRKGIECFVYDHDLGIENQIIFTLQDPEELNNPTESYYMFYSNTYLGEIFTNNELDKHDYEIKIRDILNNREDKDLIDIAKKINDESLIKVVEIPDDVEYDVCSCDCSMGECIEEKHRIWY